MTNQAPSAQPTPQCVYIVFTAEIVPPTVEAVIQALSNLAQNRVPEVYIAFSTPGGSVMAWNYALQLPSRRAIQIDGSQHREYRLDRERDIPRRTEPLRLRTLHVHVSWRWF
jgi:hypothetical protein